MASSSLAKTKIKGYNPLMSSLGELAKIHYHSRPADEWEADALIYALADERGLHVEQLWAKQVREEVYQVCSVPFFCYNIHLDDLVQVTIHHDNLKCVSNLVERSEQYTLRIWLNSTPLEERSRILDMIRAKIGGVWETKDSGLIAVSVRGIENATNAYQLLQNLEDEGLLSFETGWLEPYQVCCSWDKVLHALPDAIYTHPHPVWRDRINSALLIPIVAEAGERLYEQLWAAYDAQKDAFQICCVPFYVYEISLGDWLRVRETRTGGHKVDIVEVSWHITLRVWSNEHRSLIEVIDALRSLKCLCEPSEDTQVVGVSVPPEADLTTVHQLLQSKVESGVLGYEQSSGEGMGNYS